MSISKPHLGKGYKPGGLMILGESHYPYDEYGDGSVYKPKGETHCVQHIRWLISKYHSDEWIPPFDVCLSKALTGSEKPTCDQLRVAWRNVGFANYIGGSTDDSKRPKSQQFKASKAMFRGWLNEYKPGHVLVCGKTTWNNLPDVDEASEGEDVNAYRLNDGSYAICVAIRHPSRWHWTKVRDGICDSGPTG